METKYDIVRAVVFCIALWAFIWLCKSHPEPQAPPPTIPRPPEPVSLQLDPLPEVIEVNPFEVPEPDPWETLFDWQPWTCQRCKGGAQ